MIKPTKFDNSYAQLSTIMQTPSKTSIPKIHPAVFLAILCLIFLAPTAVTAFSGGSIPRVQIPSHTFPVFKR
jgi:hypothetical protein